MLVLVLVLVASEGVLSDGSIVLLPSNSVCRLYELTPRTAPLPQSPGMLKCGSCAKCQQKKLHQIGEEGEQLTFPLKLR